LSPERARDTTKSPLNDSRDISYNFSGIVVPPPPPLEKTIPNFVQERKADRQTDAKKPQRFLILQQLLDFHQIVFSPKKINNNNNHHLGSSKPQFLQILHKQDKAQAPPPPAGHKRIDAPQEFFFVQGWLATKT
jgi:hypothetical protein